MPKISRRRETVVEKGISSALRSAEDIDPALASLFATSSGPIVASKRSREKNGKTKSRSTKLAKDLATEGNEEDSLAASESDADLDSEDGNGLDRATPFNKYTEAVPLNEKPKIVRKRKRNDNDADLEGRYMQKLAHEESKEAERRKIRRKTGPDHAAVGGEEELGDAVSSDEDKPDTEDSDEEEDVQEVKDSDEEEEEGEEEDHEGVPQHEALNAPKDSTEFERASRTIFLGNVSSQAIASKSAKKVLLTHLSSFLSSLPPQTPPHSIESFRFRSTAYSNKLPKKAAFVKKEIMDATTKSTNAYVVYSTKIAAREAARRLNGTMVLDRHLRADEVAHPAKTEHRRCIFVGNLGFVDDDSQLQAANEEEGKRKQRKREPGDVEEGLWREFGKLGKVESVRVVRDPKTRVGKGFAYVQFVDENSVEAALLHNDKRFPPLLPRKLRVVRAKAVKRNMPQKHDSTPKTNGIYNRKFSVQEKSMQGRARKMLGRAGAAHAKQELNGPVAGSGMKAPESFVFEGHRASKSQGSSGFKLGGSGKKKGGKPRTRSSKRGSAWKATGGSKPSKRANDS